MLINDKSDDYDKILVRDDTFLCRRIMKSATLITITLLSFYKQTYSSRVVKVEVEATKLKVIL